MLNKIYINYIEILYKKTHTSSSSSSFLVSAFKTILINTNFATYPCLPLLLSVWYHVLSFQLLSSHYLPVCLTVFFTYGLLQSPFQLKFPDYAKHDLPHLIFIWQSLLLYSVSEKIFGVHHCIVFSINWFGYLRPGRTFSVELFFRILLISILLFFSLPTFPNRIEQFLTLYIFIFLIAYINYPFIIINTCIYYKIVLSLRFIY